MWKIRVVLRARILLLLFNRTTMTTIDKWPNCRIERTRASSKTNYDKRRRAALFEVIN